MQDLMKNKIICIKTLGSDQKLGSVGVPETQHNFVLALHSYPLPIRSFLVSRGLAPFTSIYLGNDDWYDVLCCSDSQLAFDWIYELFMPFTTMLKDLKSVTTTSRYPPFINPEIKTGWLPVKFRITFKLCILMHLVHIGCAPAYLSDMVTATADLSSRGRLRSSNTFRYELPLLKRKFGKRSFSYAGPKAWNDLPFALQELTDTCTFKRQLKTHLFTLAYTNSELSTGRMDPRVGSGRVMTLPEFGGSGRVSTSDFLVFLLIISWCLNRYESSNTTFGLIDLLWYLIYNN